MCHRDTTTGWVTCPAARSLHCSRQPHNTGLAADTLSTGPAAEKLFARLRGVGKGKTSICPRGGKQPEEGLMTVQLLLPTACREFTEKELQAFDPDQWAMGKLGVKAQPLVGACFPQPQEAPETTAPHERSREQIPLHEGLGTHSQIQHVHCHRLLCQHLHGGVRVDRDRATAHCKGTTTGAESGSAGRAARWALFGGPHTGRHGQAHPQNLHDPFAKTKPCRPPITLPKSHGDSFPIKREATAEVVPRESEQNQENVTPDRSLTLSPIFQGRSPACRAASSSP